MATKFLDSFDISLHTFSMNQSIVEPTICHKTDYGLMSSLRCNIGAYVVAYSFNSHMTFSTSAAFLAYKAC